MTVQKNLTFNLVTWRHEKLEIKEQSRQAWNKIKWIVQKQKISKPLCLIDRDAWNVAEFGIKQVLKYKLPIIYYKRY